MVAIIIDRSAPSVDVSAVEGHLFAGEPWSGQLTSESDESLAWSLLSAPSEMQIDPATGQLTWTASVDELGLQTISVGATDSAGNLSEVTFEIGVTSRHVNPLDPFDVDDNESVGALDALLIINVIGRAGGTIDLTRLDQTSGLDLETYYNVNGDASISALDALVVINEISRRGLSSEREFSELSHRRSR